MSDVLSRLRNVMSENGVDAVMLVAGSNRRYFSGFTGTAGTAFITANDCIFMTDSRYTLQCRKQCVGFDVKELSGKKLLTFVSGFCKDNSVKKVWIDGNDITYAQYKDIADALGEGICIENGTEYLSQIRMIKNASEIEIMKTAAQIAGQAFLNTLDEIKIGMSEIKIANTFKKHVLDLGADDTAFIIVASGENAASPHHGASLREIRKGDIVTIDFGVIYNGYNSDCTRTFGIGNVSSELEKIYNIVAKAQKESAAQVKAGAVCGELDGIARGIITQAGYGENFGHSLGHSLGLDIHEMPSLSTLSKTVLQPGMFVTVEPGIYIEGLGGVRIEDTLMVTDDGAVNITDSVPKSLFVKEFN